MGSSPVSAQLIYCNDQSFVASPDCDCACSLAPTCADATISLPSVLEMSPDLQTLPLNSSYRLVFCPSVSSIGHGIAVMNGSAWEMLSAFEHPRLVASARNQGDGKDINKILENMINLGLLTSSEISSNPVESVDILSVWLTITDRCNLGCDYCYMSHGTNDLSLETGQAIVDAAFRSALAHSYRSLKLKYAGGEPLLMFPHVEELHRYAQSLTQHSNLDLDGVVLSNGTLLTSEMIEKMKTLNLRLMISLDGLGEFHDCQRHFADDRGSFKSVARSIDLALSHGLVPEISITISGRNAEGLPALIGWVLERDLPLSINFYRENDLSISQSDLRLEEKKIVDGMLAAYKVIEDNLPSRSLLASLVDRANLAMPHLRTCAAGRDYLVFDTQGGIAKCQMDMSKIVTNNQDPDPISTVRLSSDGIRNLGVDEKDECRDCKWRYWCTGGCPLMAYRINRRYNTKSPNCEIYKQIYPHVMRLEGLRLLKYSDDMNIVVSYDS